MTDIGNKSTGNVISSSDFNAIVNKIQNGTDLDVVISSTVANNDNKVNLTLTQNDTTNNPAALSIVNTGTGAVITDGVASWADGQALTGFASVSATTITDGTMSINSGAISSVTTIGASGNITTSGGNVVAEGGVLTAGDAAQAGTLQLYDGSDHKITVACPSISGDWTMTLPIDNGAANEVLSTDGNGACSWVAGGAVGVDSSFPGSPYDGQLFFYTVDEALYMYDSTATAWIQVGGGGDTQYGTMQLTFDNGQTITIADTDNQTFALVNNDVTNNPNSMSITNTTTGNGLYIDQNGDTDNTGAALFIENTGNDGWGVRAYTDNGATAARTFFSVKSNNVAFTKSLATFENNGTGTGMYIDQNGVNAASTYGLWVYSAAVQVNSPLVFFEQDHASSDQNVLNIQNDGTGIGLYIDSNDASATESIAFKIDSASASTAGSGIFQINATGANSRYVMNITSACVGNGIYFNQTGVLAASRNALQIYSNAAQVNSALVLFKNDNAGSTSELALLQHDGSGTCLEVQNTVTELGANNSGLIVYSNVAETTTTRGLVKFWMDNAGSTKSVVEIQNDGTARALNINTGTASRSVPAVQIFDSSATDTAGDWLSTFCIQGGNNASQTAPLMYLYSYAATNQNLLRIENAGGSGVCINITNNGSGNFFTGAGASAPTLTNGGVWTDAPSFSWYKNPLGEVEDVLEKVSKLKTDMWQYKDEEIDGSNRYRGDGGKAINCTPYVDDFYEIFKLGTGEGVNNQNYAGVLFAAVKELIKENEVLKERITKIGG